MLCLGGCTGSVSGTDAASDDSNAPTDQLVFLEGPGAADAGESDTRDLGSVLDLKVPAPDSAVLPDGCAPQHEVCNNGRDDDCDSFVDCDDPGCSGAWAKALSSGKCVPLCIKSGTCDYGVFDENSLNVMASGMLSAQKVSQKNDGYFRFAVISDPHITDSPGVNNEQPSTYKGTYTSKKNPFAQSKLKKILDTIGASPLQIAFVVVTGDLVDIGESADYKQYADGIAQFMRQSSIPVFSVPGNHDLWDYGSPDATCIAHYLFKVGDPDYTFEFENSVFVATNNASCAIKKSSGARVSLDSLYAKHNGTFAQLTSLLAGYRVSYYSDSSVAPQWTILADQLTKAKSWVAKPGSYHFGFTHLPISQAWIPAANFQDDSDAMQYQKYEKIFAGKAGHAVFSGHTHVKAAYTLGTSGPARNFVLRDAYRGSWALVNVTPKKAEIRHRQCNSAGNSCMTQNGATITLLP